MSGDPLSAARFYDATTAHQDVEYRQRQGYLDAVDALVARWCRRREVASILDVGSGDGRRLARLNAQTGTSGFAIDTSPNMVAEARLNGVDACVADIVSADPSDLPHERFGLVLSLWNVLGHVGERERCRRALANMRSLVAVGGVVIFDVNNRHNAAEYGWPRVLRNLLIDTIRPTSAGNFVTTREYDGMRVSTVVHLFALDEILGLCEEASLRPVEVTFISYQDGRVVDDRWQGQICIVAEPDPDEGDRIAAPRSTG